MSKHTSAEFQRLHSLADLARFLGFTPQKLGYILYRLHDGPNGQYAEFKIKKRSGDMRTIAAPFTGLKGVQRCLVKKLNDLYVVKKSVHGFVNGRNIISNAEKHSRKRYVFNIDMKDFFPSIHFGRVMGLFMSRPYCLKREIAILISKLCCLNDVLPQGSPCSPVISNMICGYMDKQITELAMSCGCYYTRYADDMTFSTNRSTFPEEIAIYADDRWEPSPRLVDLIEEHSFKVNEKKTSMRTRSDRQLVTGLIVNEYPNIQRKQLKQVRAMLHDWKVNGADKAQEHYLKSFDLANRPPSKDTNVSFPNVVRGKLEHIRQVRTYRVDLLNKIEEQKCIRKKTHLPQKGDQPTISKDQQYYRYFQRFEQLTIRDCGVPTILGEGQTDWMHLRKAFKHFKDKGDFVGLSLNIHRHKPYAVGGNDCLQSFCGMKNERYIVSFPCPVICVFDRDVAEINKKHDDENNGYIDYGNNVYSIVLPKPAHRTTERFAIEQLYQDNDLLKEDKNGRRIFLSSEFNYKTGMHKEKPAIAYGRRARDGTLCKKLTKSDEENEKVIDSYVCTDVGGKLKNLALSKMNFAINVMREEAPFTGIDYSGFKAVFDLIQRICSL